MLIGKRERLDKINLVLYEHYYAVNAVGSSMQELVYFVSNAIIKKEVTRKEEITFLDIK